MILVDSHCHLDYLPAGAERDAARARARAAGVGAMVTIGTKITEFPEPCGRSPKPSPTSWCSVGIHPHEAAAEPETSAEALVELAQHPRVIGIGESGLDFYYEHSPQGASGLEVFRAHAEAARSQWLTFDRSYKRCGSGDGENPCRRGRPRALSPV